MRGSVYSVDVGLDAQEDVAAVWTRTSSARSDSGAVYAAVRPAATKRWSVARRLSLPPAGRQGTENAELFVTKAGEALVLWSEGDEGGVFAVIGRLQSRQWGRPRLLGYGALADVGIDGSGIATVLWWRGGRLLTTSVDIARKSWGAAQLVPISRPRQAIPGQVETIPPELAVGGSGASLVTWTRCRPGDKYACRLNRPSYFESSYRIGAKSRWRPPQLIVRGDGGWDWDYPITDTAVDSNGDATAVWIRDGSVLETATRPSAGRWRYGGQISEPADFDAVNGRSYLALGLDDANDRLLVFGANGLDNKTAPDVFALRAALQRPHDTGWRSSTLLDWISSLAPGSVSARAIRVAGSGKAIATWAVRDAQQVESGEYSTRWLEVELGDLSTDTWQPPQKLWRFSDSDLDATLGAVSAAGSAAVIWSSDPNSPGPDSVRVAVFHP